jgi:NitT/TauT family transport system substrate-binding protein
MRLILKSLIASAIVLLLANSVAFAAKPKPAPAVKPLLKIVFATDWKAQAEHGGYYQALATGLYKKAGLDVTIRQGGPAVNPPQLIAAGAVDFAMGSNQFQPLNLIAAGADVQAVAAIFQKDPQVLITHPRDDVKSIADMKGKPIMISDATISTWWVWARAKYGFDDKQIRKYTFNAAPFLTDPRAIQQGYVSSEPYLIEKEGKVKPQVFLLSDAGYPGYSNFILARGKDVRERAAIVQAFVNASIDGWASYLNGDASPANALIKKDNPEMTDDLIANGIAQMRAHGIVVSGDATMQGIGAMSDARWKEFFDLMAANGVYDKTLDFKKAYTLAFVDHGQGAPPKPVKAH